MCLISKHAHLLEKNKELEAEVARLQQPILLKSAGTIDINLMSSILLDKIEEMGDDKVELYLADIACKVYKKEDVIKFLELDETDKIVFVDELFDCDDFAAEVYGLGFGLVWTSKHALNWFVEYETNILWFVEPQQDKIAKELEDWQGWNVRMFISR